MDLFPRQDSGSISDKWNIATIRGGVQPLLLRYFLIVVHSWRIISTSFQTVVGIDGHEGMDDVEGSLILPLDAQTNRGLNEKASVE